MKTTELTKQQLLEINGGNSTTASYGGGLAIGTDSLLTLSSESHDGDDYRKTELVIGKGINLNILGLGQKQYS